MTTEINRFNNIGPNVVGPNSPRPSGIYRNALEKRIENLEEVVDTLCTQVSALTIAVETSTPAIPVITPKEVDENGVVMYETGLKRVGKNSYIDTGDK